MKELEEMKKSFDEFMAKAEQTLQRMKGTKQILDKEEKMYLENIIRPFRKEIQTIISKKMWNASQEYIYIKLRLWSNPIILPCFDSGKMYKGMKLNKEYTLKELGLFEGE